MSDSEYLMKRLADCSAGASQTNLLQLSSRNRIHDSHQQTGGGGSWLRFSANVSGVPWIHEYSFCEIDPPLSKEALENVYTRMYCSLMVDLMPTKALPELVESLSDMYRYYKHVPQPATTCLGSSERNVSFTRMVNPPFVVEEE